MELIRLIRIEDYAEVNGVTVSEVVESAGFGDIATNERGEACVVEYYDNDLNN